LLSKKNEENDLGVYVRGAWYHYKKMVQGKVYLRPLKIKRGQESLLSERVKQIEEEIAATHFGLEYHRPHTTTFIDYCQTYIEQTKDKKYWPREKQRLTKVMEFWRDPPLSVINRTSVKRLEEHLFAAGLKPATVNRYFEILRHVFNQAIEDGLMKVNPCRYYEPFIEDGAGRALEPDEVRAILKAARTIQHSPSGPAVEPVIYDLILFGLLTAMRLSEILNLRHDYIREGAVYYPVSRTKGRRRSRANTRAVTLRVTPLGETAQAIVGPSNMTGYVFPVKTRNSSVIGRAVKRIREISHVDDFTFHQLRHTTSTIIAGQESLATAKTLLGHSDLKTTLRYTHPYMVDQRAAVAKIDQAILKLAGLNPGG
jgi:integrase/recombinase XerC